MNLKTVTVTVDENGTAQVETDGFTGAECLEATKELERSLGLKTSDRKTSEYNKRTTSSTLKQGKR